MILLQNIKYCYLWPLQNIIIQMYETTELNGKWDRAPTPHTYMYTYPLTNKWDRLLDPYTYTPLTSKSNNKWGNLPELITPNKVTREMCLTEFPMDKYITYYCGMLHMGELPEDIIRIILSIMISTDEIHFRLLIAETLSFVINIKPEHIQLPKNSDLTVQEIREIMLLKIFYICINETVHSSEWKMHHIGIDNNIDNNYHNYDQLCICCYNCPSKLYNNVPICTTCHKQITSKTVKTNIDRIFKELLTVSIVKISPFTNKVSVKGFNKLIKLTRYDSINFGFVPNSKNKTKELIFIPKKVCDETREMKENLKIQNRLLEMGNNEDIEIIDSLIKKSMHILNRNMLFNKIFCITLSKDKVKFIREAFSKINGITPSWIPGMFTRNSDYSYSRILFEIAWYHNEMGKTYKTLEDRKTRNMSLIRMREKNEVIRKEITCIITDAEKDHESDLVDEMKIKGLKNSKKWEKQNVMNIQKRLEQNAQKHVSNINVKKHRITQPQNRMMRSHRK